MTTNLFSGFGAPQAANTTPTAGAFGSNQGAGQTVAPTTSLFGGSNAGGGAQPTAPAGLFATGLAPGQAGAPQGAQQNPAQNIFGGATGPAANAPAPFGAGVGAPQAAQNQQPKPAALQLSFPKEKKTQMQILESQKTLCEFLKQATAAGNEKVLADNKTHILGQLRGGFLRCELLEPRVASHDLEDQIAKEQAQFLWSDWMMHKTRLATPGRRPQPLQESDKKISLSLIAGLLQPLCESLRLPPREAHSLLQSYFCEVPARYNFIISVEEKMTAIESQVTRLAPPIGQPLANSATYNDLMQRYGQFRGLHEQAVAETKVLLQQFYLDERASLLSSLYIIFSQSSPSGGSNSGFMPLSSLVALRQDLIKDGHTIRDLIKCLKRNQQWSKEFRLLDESQRRTVVGRLQLEQIAMLELLFTLALGQDLAAGNVDFTMTHLSEYSEYLVQMEFKGHLSGGDNQSRQSQSHRGDASIINEARIKDLGILTFLAMLRIDIFAEGQQSQSRSQAKENLMRSLFTKTEGELANLVKRVEDGVQRIRPDAVNAIACLALQQVCRHIAESQPGSRSAAQFSVEFEKEITGQYFMVEVDQMLRASSLLATSGQLGTAKLDDFSSKSIDGQFLKVLKSYLNLIFEPVLVKNQMEREMEDVRSLTIEVLLKNPVILKDVWLALDNQKRGEAGGRHSKGMQPEDQEARTSQSRLQLKMFEDLLLHPMDSLPVYAYLLRVLCGKGRYRHAEHVFNMLDLQKVKTLMGQGRGDILTAEELTGSKGRAGYRGPTSSLLHELLAGYLILLDQLSSGETTMLQEGFDTFANLVVVFAKMVKQEPALYAHLNQQLTDLVELRIEERQQQDSVGGALPPQSYAIVDSIAGAELDSAIFSLVLENRESMSPQERSNPFLVLLVRSLFALARLEPVVSGELVKHNLDAITSIFSKIGSLQQPIIDLILAQQVAGLSLTGYFYRNAFDYEQGQHNFKCTISYLKFMTKIFKLDMPQLLLTQQHQLNLHQSFLDEMLRVVYSELLEHFFTFQFSSVGHFSKFVARMLKLTKILLMKFDCGNPVIKIEIKQANPRFDMLLDMIHKYLNKLQLQLLIDTLELAEIRGFEPSQNNVRQSFISNKFLAGMLKPPGPAGADHRAGRSAAINTREKLLVNEVISQSISCLNQILRMCLQSEMASSYRDWNQRTTLQQTHKDTRGLKLYYVEQLQCVQEIRRELNEPSAARRLPLKCNLVSLLAFYSKLEYTSPPSDQSQGSNNFVLSTQSLITVENNIRAAEFVKLTCQLWQSQSIKHRIDLNRFLLQNGFLLADDIKRLYLGPMIAAFRELKQHQRLGGVNRMTGTLLRYLLQMVETLALCARSQHGFIEELFDDKSSVSKDMARAVSDFFLPGGAASLVDKASNDQQRRLMKVLGQKIVEMLSAMMVERVGLGFSKAAFGIGSADDRAPLLRNIMDSLVKPICVEEAVKTKRVDLKLTDGAGRRGQEAGLPSNQQISEKVFHHCGALVTLAEFLRLVENLYACDRHFNKSVQQCIGELFSNEEEFCRFLEIQSTEDVKKELLRAYEALQQSTDYFKNAGGTEDEQSHRNQEFYLSLQRVIARDNLLSPEQADCSIHNHALVSASSMDARELSKGHGAPAAERDGSIYLVNLTGLETHQGLKFLNRSNLTLTSTSGDMISTLGNFGPEFLISSQELKYLLVNNGYDNFAAIAEYETQAKTFNLCMSALVAHMILDSAKSDFIMSIGKTKLRENLSAQSNAPKAENKWNRSFQMLASLFPLVEKDFSRGPTTSLGCEERKTKISSLLHHNLRILQGVFGSLKKEVQCFSEPSQRAGVHHSASQSLYLNFKHSETQFEYLESALSTLNMCVSGSSLQNLCQVEELAEAQQLRQFVSRDLLSHLPRVYDFHMSHLVPFNSANGQVNGSYGDKESTKPWSKATGQALQIATRRHERSYSEVFVQLVLSSFQILESITKDEQFDSVVTRDQATAILGCLSQVVRVMASIGDTAETAQAGAEHHNEASMLFNNCLRILELGINLLSESSMQEFMQKGMNQPLRIIIQRFIGTNSASVQDAIRIVQFMSTYAQSKRGAQHLYSENIFQHLQMNHCIQSVNQHDFYSDGAARSESRDPYHMLLCQVLLLLRTLNDHLLQESDEEASGNGATAYLKNLLMYIQPQGFGERITAVLCSQLNPHGVVTQALLEETELWLGIVCQLLMQADKVRTINYQVLQGLKDCLLFGLPALFARQAPSQGGAGMQVASLNEKFLHSQNASYILEEYRDGTRDFKGSRFSVFDLKAQVQLIKIYTTYSAALMDLILQDKQMTNHSFNDQSTTALFPLDWQYLSTQHESTQSQYLFSGGMAQLRHEREQGGFGALMKLAFEQVAESHDVMRAIHAQWTGPHRDQTRVLFNTMRDIVCNDENITAEYYGLNCIFVSATASDSNRHASQIHQAGANSGGAFEEFMKLFDAALSMGDILQQLMYEKTVECSQAAKHQSFGQHLGISQRDLHEYRSRVYDQR